MLYDIILARAYNAYVKEWCDERQKKPETPDGHYDLKNYHIENGFPGGESFNTLSGFRAEEFQDEAYVKTLLSPEDFEHYRFAMFHGSDDCVGQDGQDCDQCEFQPRCEG